MNLEFVKQWITRWEGTRLECYRDSRGIPTVGVGLNLTAAGARQTIAKLGVDYEALLAGAVNLTPAQVDELLLGSIAAAVSGARALLPSFDEITEDRQIVLVDLVFNLGQEALSRFVRMLGSLKSQDWDKAAAELENSAWFKEVGTGAKQRGGADVAVLRGSVTAAAVLGLEESCPGNLERVEAVACLLWAA